VLQVAQRRQGKPLTPNAISRNPNEHPPDPRPGRWKRAKLDPNCSDYGDTYRKCGIWRAGEFTRDNTPRAIPPYACCCHVDNRGIDVVLARHYGFTEEELDFIINYDIKYRMGGDA